MVETIFQLVQDFINIHRINGSTSHAKKTMNWEEQKTCFLETHIPQIECLPFEFRFRFLPPHGHAQGHSSCYETNAYTTSDTHSILKNLCCKSQAGSRKKSGHYPLNISRWFIYQKKKSVEDHPIIPLNFISNVCLIVWKLGTLLRWFFHESLPINRAINRAVCIPHVPDTLIWYGSFLSHGSIPMYPHVHSVTRHH